MSNAQSAPITYGPGTCMNCHAPSALVVEDTCPACWDVSPDPVPDWIAEELAAHGHALAAQTVSEEWEERDRAEFPEDYEDDDL